MTGLFSRFPVAGRRTWLRVALVTAIAAAGTGLAPRAAVAAATPPDGSSAYRAAASCWEIKQNLPSSPDGVYWLLTPTMQRPDQFYCDMTVDGGGWVLIGRGREGWRSEYEGLSTPTQLRSTVTGPSAFAPAQLPAKTVDALAGGGRIDALPDGIRLRRAVNTAGTQWQETRFNFASRDRWSWAFRARFVTKNVTFDGVSAPNSFTYDFGSDNTFRRVNTTTSSAQGYTGGFGFGSSARGTNDPNSYIWSLTPTAGYPRPFTQMFIRPRLTQANFTATIPDSGTPAFAQTPLANTKALTTTWGVSGLASNGGADSELRSEVQAFAQIGDYMYVGGNFRYVQRTQAGGGQVEQSYVAAFNVNTGEWLSSFRPTFDNQVKSLAALPNGKLAVGGEFTHANGAPAGALVALDPITGATATGWSTNVENRLTTGVLAVKALSVQGSWLYLGGLFTHLSGGTRPSAVYARSGARVSVVDGTPDPSWNPNLNGSANDIEASADGTRAYLAGYFTTSNNQAANKAVALTTAAGAPLVNPPWSPTYSSAANFQFTVTETPNKVWLGGSEHSFFSYNRQSLVLESGNISLQGGDFQTSTATADVVYGGCHCDDWNYSNAYTWSDPGTTWTQADKLGFVGAWNAHTAAYEPEFDPILDARNGYGAWASAVDSTGTLWIGGSFDQSRSVTDAIQWSGGFVRFSGRDTTAPTSPGGLAAVKSGDSVVLSWTGSSDGGNPVTYEVLKDDRVVATSSTTSVTLPMPAAPTRYFVRAADPSGNRSASTQALAFDPGAGGGGAQQTLIDFGGTWSWRYDSAPLAPDWATPAFDASSWAQGPAPLGFGSTPLGTVIYTGAPSTRPLAAQFRAQVTVPDPAAWDSLKLQVAVDDGAVVYLNGVEVARANLPAGTITQNTYATAAPRTSTANASLLVVTVPASSLVAGSNTIAVETHLNYRSTTDASMKLKAELLKGVP